MNRVYKPVNIYSRAFSSFAALSSSFSIYYQSVLLIVETLKIDPRDPKCPGIENPFLHPSALSLFLSFPLSLFPQLLFILRLCPLENVKNRKLPKRKFPQFGRRELKW